MVKISLEEKVKKEHLNVDIKEYDKLSISPTNLYNNGWSIFKDTFRSANFLMQKRFDDEGGKKFFINISFYEVTVKDQTFYSWSASAQMTLAHSTIDINYSSNKNNIEDVQEFFDRVWQSMGFEYYDCYELERQERRQEIAQKSWQHQQCLLDKDLIQHNIGESIALAKSAVLKI